ncbi:hypothetical protein Baya_0253 [Bagarius yarrelli]|uniref:Uncharacterized protein n=1 Tax=Bagarius yarrelli TaxID=175774 RepID=A0A556THR8_BAGYA|nr:hypothetical protein Baya_0253 [Bagarius yarrelli]
MSDNTVLVCAGVSDKISSPPHYRSYTHVCYEVVQTEVDVQTIVSCNMNRVIGLAQALQQALVIQTESRQPVPEELSTLSSAHIKAHLLPFHGSINNNHCWSNDQLSLRHCDEVLVPFQPSAAPVFSAHISHGAFFTCTSLSPEKTSVSGPQQPDPQHPDTSKKAAALFLSFIHRHTGNMSTASCNIRNVARTQTESLILSLNSLDFN